MKSPALDRAASALCAWLVPLVLFALAPAAIVREAGVTFGFTHASLTPSLLLGAGAGLLLTLFVLRGRAGGKRRGAALFLIGFFLFASLRLVPAHWTLFSSDEALEASAAEIVTELVLLVLLILAYWLVPKRLLVWTGAIVTLTVASVATVSVVRAWTVPAPKPLKAPMEPASTGPNIYHFVFDGFSARALTPEIRQRIAPALTGFTFFPNNRANYFATDASLPSIFTGSIFTGGSFRAFQTRARLDGIRRALQEHGYRVSTYVPDRNRFWWFDSADAPVTNQDLARHRFDPDGWKSLVQMSVVRATPAGLRVPIVWLTRLILPASMYNHYKQHPAMLDRFLADEPRRPARGQYVYFHIMMPHPPYHYGADCRRDPDASYTTQAHCAVTMMLKMVDELRRLGRLRDSLVIFQGDHGFQSSESDLPDVRDPMPPAVRRKLNSLGDSYNADELMQRSHALLLAKLPGAPQLHLTISPKPTQLIDISATIARTAGFAPYGIGRPIFTPDADGPRAWHFFAGVTSKAGLFRKRLGRDTTQGRLAHISVDPDGHWHIHPDIVANGPGEIPGR